MSKMHFFCDVCIAKCRVEIDITAREPPQHCLWDFCEGLQKWDTDEPWLLNGEG